MKKRAAALAFCLLLAFQLAAPPARSAGSVYFTAAGNEILPLNDSTMPFWSNGYLYVASSIFTGQVNKSLGVAYLPSSVSNPDLWILYGGGRSLMFDLKQNLVRDTEGNISFLAAIRRGSEVFVPASLVADFFQLEYSVTPLSVSTVTDANYGALVWLRRGDFNLSEKEFVAAATSQIAMRYEQYLREETQGTDPPSPDSPQRPVTVENKSIYLCLEGDETTASLLDVLDEQGAQAAFFCSLDFLDRHGDLLRRMTVTGHAVGLLVDAGDPERTVAEQLEAANAALEGATMGKSRLVKIRNGDERAVREAEDRGFSCFVPDLDRSDGGLRDGAQAEALLRQVSARRGDVGIWLGGGAAAAGLRAFLSAAGGAEDRCLALTETVL